MSNAPWRTRYEEAHRAMQAREYPTATKDFGWLATQFPDVRRANGLTRMIVNFLNWSGHHGERTNTMGRPIKHYAPKFNIMTGKVEQLEHGVRWQKGSGTLGSSDIKGHFKSWRRDFAIPIYIEVKIGRDRQSEAQQKYEKSVTASGALYVLVGTPEDFFIFYDYLLSL